MTRLFGPLPTALQDVALLAARLLLGVVLAAHGWQKFNEFTLAGTAGAFDQMGVPAPGAAATFAAVVELGAGALLILGFLTTLASLLVVLNMAGAYLFVHAGAGVFVDSNGFELVAVIAAGVLVLGTVGAGRLSVDGLIAGRGANAAPAAREEEKVTPSV